MSPALQIQEILINIFGYIAPIRYSEDGLIHRKSLLSAALTCRAFRSPALDILWQQMDSDIPLLRLLSVVQVERVLVSPFPMKLSQVLLIFSQTIARCSIARFLKVIGLASMRMPAEYEMLKSISPMILSIPRAELYTWRFLDHGETSSLRCVS